MSFGDAFAPLWTVGTIGVWLAAVTVVLAWFGTSAAPRHERMRWRELDGRGRLDRVRRGAARLAELHRRGRPATPWAGPDERPRPVAAPCDDEGPGTPGDRTSDGCRPNS
ncbi:hypothetical protein KC207_05355 [Phycicoccus sp. BSK3Z-2]|uniref:Uncharacterized protein n=1 Tax=Phycicoccus avicenniae TaxID=2828860 RepID=A0A941HZA4_9MICO|nr:hypothetical protein [Phycicoccus avicenniae]MBR7742715.1 hypothetical protein [Phycicoccus avicenniae]